MFLTEDTVNERGLEPLLEILSSNDEFGGWPLIGQEYKVGKVFDVMEMEAANARDFAAYSFFKPEVSIDIYNTSRSILYLNPMFYTSHGVETKYQMSSIARPFIEAQGFHISEGELSYRVNRTYDFFDSVRSQSRLLPEDDATMMMTNQELLLEKMTR